VGEINLGTELELRGLSQFLTGLKKVQGESGKTRKAMSFDSASKGIRRVGRGARATGRALAGLGKIVGGLTLGLGAGIGASLAKFGEFELQMARVGTLLEPGRKAMDEFGDLVNRRSVQFGQDAGVMADAVFQAISAGVDASTESVEQFSDVVGRAAVGGFTQAATVVDGLTTVLNAFGEEAGTAMEVSDRFFVANKLGKTTFEELSNSIGRVAPTAKALGVSFDEVLATTVSLTKGGIKTSEVMSGLKATFSSIKNASDEAKKTAQDLGLEFSLEALRAKGLDKFLGDLVRTTKGNTVAQAKLFGSIEAFNAVARLASQEGARDFKTALDQLKNSAGATEQAYTRVANTTGHKLKQIKQGFGRFVRDIGQGLAEGFGIHEIKNIPDAVANASKTLKRAARSFATSFKEAFAPAKAFGALNLEGAAKNIGKAVASLANTFMQALRAIPAVVSGISSIARGLGHVVGVAREILGLAGDPLAERARAAGGYADVGVETITLETIRGISEGKRGAAAANVMKRAIENYSSGTGGGASEAKLRLLRVKQAAANLINEQERAKIESRQEKINQRVQAKAVREFAGAGDPGANAGAIALQEGGIAAAGFQERTRARLTGQPVNVEVTVNNQTEVKGKKKKKKRRFGARGRGSATIESTLRQRYLIAEDRIVPVSDEFIFTHLLATREV